MKFTRQNTQNLRNFLQGVKKCNKFVFITKAMNKKNLKITLQRYVARNQISFTKRQCMFTSTLFSIAFKSYANVPIKNSLVF